MTYKEYIATKPRFVYHGESETELKEKLENITGYKYMDTKNHKYDPVKPPAGIIYVENDEDKGWISGKMAFYGWNIMRNMNTNDIEKSLSRGMYDCKI